MTKKLRVYLLIILSALCAACAFAGCKVGRPGREEVLAGYKAHVTYYSNGGYFDGSTTLTVRDLYFKHDPNMEGYNPAGVPFFDITGETASLKVERSGYDLVGWFVPEVYKDGDYAGQIMYTYTYKADGDKEVTIPVYPLLDEDGDPVTDRDNDRPVFYNETLGDKQIKENEVRVTASDEVITSDRLIADEENLIVCAKWVPSLKIIYKLVCEEGKTYTDAKGNSYKNGDELRSDDFGNGEYASPSSLAPAALNGASFVRSYLDNALTQTIEPIERPEDNVDPVVYAHYIDGDNWTIIDNDASKVVSMFNSLSADDKYYIIEDVDCEGRTFSLKNQNNTVNATIVGNGHTISNLKFGIQGTAGQGMVFSVFSNAGASFSVSGLTLKNINIEFTARNNTTLYAVFNGVNNGAKFDDFVIDGIAATVQLPLKDGNYVTNAQNGDRSRWLFGGTSTSDAAFLEAHTGIDITGETTLTITD